MWMVKYLGRGQHRHHHVTHVLGDDGPVWLSFKKRAIGASTSKKEKVIISCRRLFQGGNTYCGLLSTLPTNAFSRVYLVPWTYIGRSLNKVASLLWQSWPLHAAKDVTEAMSWKKCAEAKGKRWGAPFSLTWTDSEYYTKPQHIR